MENIKMEFKHPKYYKELRKRNTEAVAKLGKSHASLKSDQAISTSDSTECSDKRASDPGLKLQAREDIIHEENERLLDRSSKPQATSSQAASDKLQAPSCKHQASSRKRQAP